MAVQVQNNIFADERARRFNQAMDLYPTARYLEILPFLCLFAQKEIRDWHVVDLASGGGYLGRFFENVVDKVTYVDRSPDMLEHIESPNTIVSDMRDPSSSVGKNQADIVTCLAAFHHVHVPRLADIGETFAIDGTRCWTPEHYLNITLSQEVQDAAMRDWHEMLKPGGWLALIDVPGYPDPAWNPFWTSGQPHTINTKGYQQQFFQQLANWPLNADLSMLTTLFKDVWQDLWDKDEQIHALCQHLRTEQQSTLQDLIDSYQLPPQIFRESAPMAPTDFFDDVIDRLGNQRHFGYFPRESQARGALEAMGMTNILSGTFPTPWVFDSRESAVWFVHELFGFDSTWERNSIPEREFIELDRLLEKYLGFHKDGFGRTLLYWQLNYFVAQKSKLAKNSNGRLG